MKQLNRCYPLSQLGLPIRDIQKVYIISVHFRYIALARQNAAVCTLSALAALVRGGYFANYA